MIILPYSTALTLSKRPVVTYAVAAVCVLVFLLQLTSDITESLMYYPNSWNPLTMITASVAHGGWLHLTGNLIFFLAFAPAIELLIGTRLRYLWFMLLISFIVGISYSISVLISNGPSTPTLGLSGVVMSIIGLSAFLMPHAKIKVFWWFYIAWKTFYVPVWALAVCYISLDIFTMLTASSYGGINVVAHVAGGLAGFLYGYLRLKNRRRETRQELDHETQAMEIERKFGKTRSESFRARDTIEQRQATRSKQLEQDKFMGRLYQMVKTHRSSEAIVSLLSRYGEATPTNQLEALFEAVRDWGPSRTVLCLGRFVINKLEREKRYGRAIFFIEKCQAISPQFMLHDVSRTLFYAQMAIETGKHKVAESLLKDAPQRYGTQLNHAQCNHLLQKSRVK